MIDLSMLPDFINEAIEHLEELENSLLRLEEHQEDTEVLNDIFRAMHTIKGAAQFVGIDRVSELSHKLETLLDLVRRGEQPLNEDLLDLLIDGKDRISLLVNELEKSQEEETPVDDLLQRIDRVVAGGGDGAPDAEAAPAIFEQEVISHADGDLEGGGEKKEAAGLESDIIGEEHDEELFAIFLQQLQENIPFLQSQIAELSTSLDKKDVLNRCSSGIKSLQSSANYMGYEKLNGHYIKWQEAIAAAEEELSAGGEPDLAFMQDYIDEIVRAYPGAMEGQEHGDSSDSVADVLDSLFSDESPAGPVAGAAESPPAAEEQSDLEAVLDSALSDSFAESLTGAGGDSGLATLENETAGEEYDEELLEIFMQQLQENIPFLQSQIGELATSGDKRDVLKRCSNGIRSLQPSANYMGYEKLSDHYLQWQEAITEAEEQLAKGEAPDLAFMQERIDTILRTYPQAMPDRLDSDESAEVSDALASLFAEEAAEPLDEGGEDSALAEGQDDDSDAELAAVLRDAFADPLGGREEERGVEALENEALEEEYDEELLEIFMQQLQENIPFLHAQIAELALSADKQEILDRCTNGIKGLQSSANYMGYEKLTGFYNSWQEEIEGAVEQLAAGAEPDLAFMQSRIDGVIAAYPRAMAGEEQEPVAASIDESDDEFEDITDTIGALLSVPPVAEYNEEKETTAVETPVAETAAEVEDESQAPVTLLSDGDEDLELFNRLSSALDASLEQEGNIPLKPMHTVIEKMIAPLDEGESAVDAVAPAVVEEPEAKAAGKGADLQKKDERRQEDRRQEERRQEQRRAQKDAPAKIKQTMRVDTEKIDYLMNQVGELVVSRAYFAQLFAEMKTMQQDLHENFGLTKSELKPVSEFAFRLGEAGVALGRVSNELQEGVMKVRMLPIAQLFKRFPRLVRDLVHKTDKKVKLETRGEETELDKMVVEEISDPLIHILRNAVDHGIESAEERKRLGKPETGTVTLEAYHESDHIVIDVTDDGRGLDIERIKDKALAKGLYSRGELNRMSEVEIKHIIMQPGFSTAEKATKTSGRGVGMDVVKKNVEKLNGSVEIDTKAGEGSRIRIKIPLTMAIIQALMVRVGREKFTIPLTTVEETLRIFQRDISEIEGVDVIHLRDTTMPIFRLSKVFGMRDEDRESDKLFVVVVSTGLTQLGLVVDELLGQEEVVIKPLADYLRTESGFSGATILGTGGISLILDVPELVKMTTDQQVIKQKKLSYRRQMSDSDGQELQIPGIH